MFEILLTFIKTKKEKRKMCNFPLTDFFRTTCAIRFLMSKAFQKVKFYQNLKSGSWSKQRFRLLQEKAAVSIKARF